MTQHVLDASALLALINNEPGADRVASFLSGAIMSTVNCAEVMTVLSELGVPLQDGQEMLSELVEQIVSFDEAQALITASLLMPTKHKGLSLGDRACLALGKMKKLPVVTADKAWGELTLGIQIIVIR